MPRTQVYPLPRAEIAKRFWSRVKQGTLDECWEWQGYRMNTGYGQFSIRTERGKQGKTFTDKAHRWAWRLERGEIPNGKQVCHTCDNRPCCNLNHLFLGTSHDNHQDAMQKGRYPLGEKRHNARFTTKQIREIRRRAAHGEKRQSLALRFNTTRGYINDIVRYARWKHVK